MPDPVLRVVMCKYPTPGRVKTRLMPALSAEQAAEVSKTFLLHLNAKLGGSTLYVVDPPDADWRGLLGDVPTRPQAAGHLGDRLIAAAVDAVSAGGLLFLGLDSPDLPDAALARAADLLADADVVLGPTDDGGYWCLGLSPAVDPAALLAGIDWSSGREFTQTLGRAESLGYRTALADRWPDVDYAEDLTALLDRLSRSGEPSDRRLLDALHFLPDAPRPASDRPEGFS